MTLLGPTDETKFVKIVFSTETTVILCLTNFTEKEVSKMWSDVSVQIKIKIGYSHNNFSKKISIAKGFYFEKHYCQGKLAYSNRI